MANTIEENNWIVLTAMATQQADASGRISLSGQKIQEITNLKPAEINDAIEILENAGYVKLMKFLGTTPFLFGIATITPNGKNEYQQRSKQIPKEEEIQFPPHFTPAMKDMILGSAAVFDSMKSTLLSSLIDAGKKYRLNDGLYYVVLIDLSGSTNASSKMNNATYSKWINDFVQITQDALTVTKRNIAVYIKSIGDGSLFLFLNFDDILDWSKKVHELCSEYNEKCASEKRPDFHLYYNKIIVHSGEVYFNERGDDTQSFAVNVVFKIEKEFKKNNLGITEAVKQAIAPEINSGRFQIEKVKDFSLDNGNVIIPLWKLSMSKNLVQR